MTRKTSFGAVFALAMTLFCSNAFAQQIELGYGVDNEIELVAETANQRVDFLVSNIAGKNYDTFELFILLGDGGAIANGSDTGPRLTSVELGNSGTVFDGGTRGSGLGGSQTDLLWADFIDSVTATADGVVGTMVFDTTGIAVGTTLDIQFENIELGPQTFNTNFRNADTTEFVTSNSNGIIRVVAVPEPSSALLLFAVTGLAGLRRQR
jgi:hypothetical protein